MSEKTGPALPVVNHDKRLVASLHSAISRSTARRSSRPLQRLRDLGTVLTISRATRKRGEILASHTEARSRRSDTTLQRHVSFFDDNGDRGVGVGECARGSGLGCRSAWPRRPRSPSLAALSLQTRGSLLQ